MFLTFLSLIITLPLLLCIIQYIVKIYFNKIIITGKYTDIDIKNNINNNNQKWRKILSKIGIHILDKQT
mgnify:FL=1